MIFWITTNEPVHNERIVGWLNGFIGSELYIIAVAEYLVYIPQSGLEKNHHNFDLPLGGGDSSSSLVAGWLVCKLKHLKMVQYKENLKPLHSCCFRKPAEGHDPAMYPPRWMLFNFRWSSKICKPICDVVTN